MTTKTIDPATAAKRLIYFAFFSDPLADRMPNDETVDAVLRTAGVADNWLSTNFGATHSLDKTPDAQA